MVDSCPVLCWAAHRLLNPFHVSSITIMLLTVIIANRSVPFVRHDAESAAYWMWVPNNHLLALSTSLHRPSSHSMRHPLLLRRLCKGRSALTPPTPNTEHTYRGHHSIETATKNAQHKKHHHRERGKEGHGQGYGSRAQRQYNSFNLTKTTRGGQIQTIITRTYFCQRRVASGH